MLYDIKILIAIKNTVLFLKVSLISIKKIYFLQLFKLWWNKDADLKTAKNFHDDEEGKVSR